MANEKNEITVLLVGAGSYHRFPLFSRIANRVDNLILLNQVNTNHEYLKNFANILEIPQDFTAEAVFKSVQAFLQEEEWTLDGILTYDDYWIELTSDLCSRFEIPEVRYTPPEVVGAVRDKYHFRKICNSMEEFHSCRSLVLHDGFDLSDVEFPCIMKPQKGAGSFFCKKLNDEEEFEDEFSILQRQYGEYLKMSFLGAVLGKHFLLEELIEGEEFDVDGYCANSKILMSLVSWNAPSDEYGSEFGGLYPSNFAPEDSDRIISSLSALLEKLGNVSSFFHFEGMLMKTGEIFPIELNLRIAGAEAPCTFQHLTNVHPGDVIYDLALGLELPSPVDNFSGFVRSTNHRLQSEGIITSVDVSPELQKSPWYVGHSVFFKAGQRYHQKYNGSMGTVYWLAASGETAELAELHLQELQAFIKISAASDQVVA